MNGWGRAVDRFHGKHFEIGLGETFCSSYSGYNIELDGL